MKEYQVGEKVTYNGQQVEVVTGYDQGWYGLKVNGKVKDVFVDEINPQPRPVQQRGYTPPGYYSNAIIQRRNGGVRHQFQDSIGGCSSNYR